MNRLRLILFRAALLVLLTLAVFGHVLVLVLGALDALVTAFVGVPRLSYASGRLVRVVAATWKESL
ncbi:hypothetical protein [Nonomuraea typhae]|uniref:hypothetical protein n=1 Tax=Nonomuraea typhae TaxID=2603600 RepID=UPI0012FB8C32|nr:hypothetical protein [Nonomuraea typhae]